MTSSPIHTEEAGPGLSTPTRQRLLEAGVQVWLDEPPATLFGGYTVSRVAKAAGVTRATFYAYWPSTEHYLSELVTHLVDGAFQRAYERDVSATAGAVGRSHTGAADLMLDACDREFQRLVTDPNLRLRLGFLSKMDDPEVAAALRDGYRRVEALKAEAYESTGDTWGREPRPPFDLASAQALYQMVGEIMAARHLIDPETFPAELYGLVILGLMMFVSRRTDDTRTLPELIRHINNWPTAGNQLREQRQAAQAARSAAVLDHDTAEDVVREARRLQGTMGWNELTLPEIGSIAGVSDQTLLRTFGSKAGLAMSIVDLAVGERLDAMGPLEDPVASTWRTLDVTADELRRDVALSHSALQLFTGAAALPPGDILHWSQIRASLLRDLQGVQAAGHLRPDIDPDQLGATLVRLLVTDHAPKLGMTAAPVDVVGLVLAGAGVPPRPQPARA